jgi:HAD superfamily hydrolase (TIGR01509 family)
MKIRLLIFDWSGVFSDDRKPAYDADMRILRDYGKPVMTFEKWIELFKMTPVEFYNDQGIRDDPKKLFALYKKYFDDEVRKGSKPKQYPGTKEVLRHFKRAGKKTAVLSSHPEENVKEEARRYHLDGFVDLVLGSATDKVKGLKSICRKMREKPESALYVGDLVFDIRAAKKAGVHSAAVCTGYQPREILEKEKPEFLLDSLSELKNIVE